MFEEAKHLDDFLEGLMESLTSVKIEDEVRAKIWVVDNILNIKKSYVDELEDGVKVELKTHYGWVMMNSKFPNTIKKGLEKGVYLTTYENYDRYRERKYRVWGTGKY